MCAVSMITDYYRDKWPVSNLPSIFPTTDFKPIFPQEIKITPAQWQEYQELKKKMEEYDVQTNQPDCVKPDVVIWEAIIEQIIKDQKNEEV